MENKTKYICPPKLQTKLLLGFWTIPELLIIGFVLIAGFYLLDLLIGVSIGMAVCTARIDLENSLISKVAVRVRYYHQIKTYRNMR